MKKTIVPLIVVLFFCFLSHGTVFARLNKLEENSLLSISPLQEVFDPLEPLNRIIFHANIRIWSWFQEIREFDSFVPKNKVEEFYTSQILVNLSHHVAEPFTAIHAVMIGQGYAAANAAARFSLNTSLGLAGALDVADNLGFPRRHISLADVMCYWSIPQGPYIEVPLMGGMPLRNLGANILSISAVMQTITPDVPLSLPLRLLMVRGVQANISNTELPILKNDYETTRHLKIEIVRNSCQNVTQNVEDHPKRNPTMSWQVNG